MNSKWNQLSWKLKSEIHAQPNWTDFTWCKHYVSLTDFKLIWIPGKTNKDDEPDSENIDVSYKKWALSMSVNTCWMWINK